MACTEPSWNGTGAFGITVDVKDAVQGGMLKNCSLIAGIASLAWKQKIGIQPGPSYTFNFYRTVNNVTITDPQQTDGIIPNPLQAKSDDPTEFWPSLYEKAYYQWLEQLGLTKPSARPKYCSHTEWQDPSTVLFQLTGKNVSPKPATPLVAINAFNNIDAFCVNLVSSTNRAIQSAAVAWTYDTGAQYSDTKIIAKHTYSLLGVAGRKNAQGTWTDRYVVLRNPYGKDRGDPTGLPEGSLYTATLWSRNINLGNNDGIFALRYDLFAQYFAGYAWVLL